MRVYLAGPEVFLPDAADLAAAKKRICAAHGFEGVFPTDPVPAALAETEEWFRLYRVCEAHLRRCDVLVANMTPFRGPSADAGTVFEMGLMRGLGRPVFAYSNVGGELRDRVAAAVGTPRPRPGGGCEDADGMLVEEFGLADNLMLEGGVRASGGAFFKQAVPAVARWRDLHGFERCVAAAARLFHAAAARQLQPGSTSSA